MDTVQSGHLVQIMYAQNTRHDGLEFGIKNSRYSNRIYEWLTFALKQNCFIEIYVYFLKTNSFSFNYPGTIPHNVQLNGLCRHYKTTYKNHIEMLLISYMQSTVQYKKAKYIMFIVLIVLFVCLKKNFAQT